MSSPENNHPQKGEAPTEPTSKRPPRGGWRRGTVLRGMLLGFVLVAAIVLAAFVILYIIQHRIPLLAEADYRTAVARWSKKAPENYSMDVQIGGHQPGDISATIHHGKVVRLTRNGAPVTQKRTWEFWTVPVLLESIGEDLELRTNPGRKADKFKIPPEADMMVRAVFDPEFGYPRRYRRSIANTNQDIEWTITRFAILSAPADDNGKGAAAQ